MAAHNDEAASPAAVAAAAEHEFRFRILGSRPAPAGSAAVPPKTTTTTTTTTAACSSASSVPATTLKKEEPSHDDLVDPTTVGDETLLDDLGDAQYAPVDDAVNEGGGGGGGTSPALASTSAVGAASSSKVASERILADKDKVRSLTHDKSAIGVAHAAYLLCAEHLGHSFSQDTRTRPPPESVNPPAAPATSPTNAATIASAVPAPAPGPASVAQPPASAPIVDPARNPDPDPDSGPKRALQASDSTREIIADFTDEELDELYAQVVKSRETLGPSEHARRFGEMERASGVERERRRKLAAAAARSGPDQGVPATTMTSAAAAATCPQTSSSTSTTVASGPAVTTFEAEPSHDLDPTAGENARSFAELGDSDTRTVVAESMHVDAADENEGGGGGTRSPAVPASAGGTVTAVATSTERGPDKVRESDSAP